MSPRAAPSTRAARRRWRCAGRSSPSPLRPKAASRHAISWTARRAGRLERRREPDGTSIPIGQPLSLRRRPWYGTARETTGVRMTAEIAFKKTMEFAYGQPRELAPGVVRLVANNPSPFTFHGTNTYLVGTKELALIDPGPEDDAHFEAIMRAAAGRPIT